MLRKLFSLPQQFEDFVFDSQRQITTLRVELLEVKAEMRRELSQALTNLEDARNQRDFLQRKLFEVLGIADINGNPAEVPEVSTSSEMKNVSRRRMPWHKLKRELEVASAREHGDRLAQYWEGVRDRYRPVVEKKNASEKSETVRKDGPSDEGTRPYDSSLGREGVRQEDAGEEASEFRKSLEDGTLKG